MTGGWSWVVWGYAVTYVALGGYAVSVLWRTAAARRRLQRSH